MADDIGSQGDGGNQQALIGDVEAQAAGKDAVLGVAGLLLHDVVLALLHAQSQGGETVGNQVDEEQMDGVQQGKAQQVAQNTPRTSLMLEASRNWMALRMLA